MALPSKDIVPYRHRQGMNGYGFFWGHFCLDRRVVQKYRVFFCANCAILVVLNVAVQLLFLN
jgi:hypothetical protein